MTQPHTTTDTTMDPVCGKTVDPQNAQFTARDDKGTHYFCSDGCRRKFESADKKAKKGFWARYTDRLKKTHCTQTPPECH